MSGVGLHGMVPLPLRPEVSARRAPLCKDTYQPASSRACWVAASHALSPPGVHCTMHTSLCTCTRRRTRARKNRFRGAHSALKARAASRERHYTAAKSQHNGVGKPPRPSERAGAEEFGRRPPPRSPGPVRRVGGERPGAQVRGPDPGAWAWAGRARARRQRAAQTHARLQPGVQTAQQGAPQPARGAPPRQGPGARPAGGASAAGAARAAPAPGARARQARPSCARPASRANLRTRV